MINIQLKDGVAFAMVESPYHVENSVILQEGLSWDDVKAKKFNNGNWEEPDLIYFVTEIKDGMVHQTNSTVFSSDVTGDIVSAEVTYGWVKNEDGTYSEPQVIEETPAVEDGTIQ